MAPFIICHGEVVELLLDISREAVMVRPWFWRRDGDTHHKLAASRRVLGYLHPKLLAGIVRISKSDFVPGAPSRKDDDADLFVLFLPRQVTIVHFIPDVLDTNLELRIRRSLQVLRLLFRYCNLLLLFLRKDRYFFLRPALGWFRTGFRTVRLFAAVHSTTTTPSTTATTTHFARSLTLLSTATTAFWSGSFAFFLILLPASVPTCSVCTLLAVVIVVIQRVVVHQIMVFHLEIPHIHKEVVVVVLKL